MKISISTMNSSEELKPIIEEKHKGKPNKKIPNYWEIDIDIDDLFSLSKELEDVGYIVLITKSFNLYEGKDLPSIHLYENK